MSRKGVIAVGEYYHVYNRGVDRRTIFYDEYDYRRFIMLMYLSNGTRKNHIEDHFRSGRSFDDIFNVERGDMLVAIDPWCLMPNHFHMLCKEIVPGGMQKFMHRLCTGYAGYVNRRYDRTGALFEGRYKAQHVESDRHLRYLYGYIHLNPVKLLPGESDWKEKGISNIGAVKKFLLQYPYSSMTVQNRGLPHTAIQSSEHFPGYFENVDSMITEVQSFLV